MPYVLPDLVETTDAAPTISTSYNLSIGQTAQGTISSFGDHDWYRVSLVAGQTYTFAEIGTGTNSLRDTYLNLRNSSGTIVEFDDDAGPAYGSSLRFTATTTGTYYIDAGAYADALTGQYGVTATLGTRPNFDIPMGGGAIDAYRSWSPSGTPATVTYGFRQSSAAYTVTGHNTATFTQVSPDEMAAVQAILQLWSDVAGVTFVPVNPGGYTNSATILIGNYSDARDGSGAFAFYPGSTASTAPEGDLWLNLSGGVSTSSIPLGSYSFFTIMHELGHALGLSHPGDYNAAPGVTITYAQFAQFVQDSQQYSVMSYFGGSATGESPGLFATAYTPMMFDIYELQRIYGANNSTRVADTVYGFGSNAGSIYDFSVNSTPQFCIWDAGGIDTLNCSGFSQNEVINLNAGTFSNVGGGTANVSIAIGAAIENATGGGGNDAITGNSYNNILTGGGGNDAIDGGAGTDTVVYGGLRWQYQTSLNPIGLIHIVDGRAGAPNGADDVINAEFFQFADYTVPAARITNHPPIATATDYMASKAQVIGASLLFSASDADNDTLSYYFYDNTPDATSGHFTVNGVVQPANMTFGVTAAQLAQTTFTAGSGVSDDLFVNVYDGSDWSGAKEFHVVVPPNHAPTVIALDFSLPRGQTISASSMFEASDADGDTLLYGLRDNSADPTSGHFTVNGVVHAAGTTFVLTAAQLAQTTFTAGTFTSDDLLVNVYDGFAFSEVKGFRVNVPANNAPTVIALDFSLPRGQTISASSMFGASDGDNDTLLYGLRDNSADPTSGHFTVNGVVQAAGTTFVLTAAQLAQTTFTAGTFTSDDLLVNVYDGFAFSEVKEFRVNVPANHAPTAIALDFSWPKGQVISASSMFGASDADNDTLTYFFYDNTPDPASGHFTVNGAVQPANTTFGLSAAQLAQTTFTAGLAVSDDLFVNVYDGHAFSGPQEFHVNVPPNHAPVVTAPDFSATRGQVIAASSLFTATDADSDTLLYGLRDNSADPTSGHFTVNGVVQAANATFVLTAAQLAQTTFTAGSLNSDDLLVNIYDGQAFSEVKAFHVNVPMNHAPTATARNQSSAMGQVSNAASLFSASDVDNDVLTYFFYDNTPSAASGHFTVNGAVQAANTTFAVSAAQLAQTTFTAGSVSDDLFVNVYDGFAFSGPQEFHILV